MDHAIIISVLLSTMVAVTIWTTPEQGALRRAFLNGISLWCQWLPVISTLIYMLIVALSLTHIRAFSPLSLTAYFSTPELLVLLLAGPMFLTRAGNLIAIATIIFGINNLLADSGSLPSTPSLIILVASLTMNAVLADRMPWHPKPGYMSTAPQIREYFFIAVCGSSIAFTAIAVVKVRSLGIWISRLFPFDISDPALFLILCSVLLGWLGVLLGYTRHTIIPALCLPTYLISSYLTRLPNHMLIIPFIATIALSLASADRFYNLSRIVRR